MTGKQRVQFRGLANSTDTVLHAGKDDIEDNLAKQVDDALETRESIKGKVLESSLPSNREAAEALASATRSQVVQVIGAKLILYRPTHKRNKKDRIVLVTDRKRK